MRVASRLASAPRPSVARLGTTSCAQRAALSVSARRLKSEVIKENEVPVSVYSPDSKGASSANSDHFSIPVRPGAAQPSEKTAAYTEEGIAPITPKMFSQMPKTMQKMSVMGKVIVITGYVSLIPFCPSRSWNNYPFEFFFWIFFYTSSRRFD